jgi:phytoene desaturase
MQKPTIGSQKEKISNKNVAIIGTGIGGLASAALLAKEGYKVTVFEKNDQPGGRAWLFKDKGFTFDMGPSWLLMPDVYRKFFKEFGLELDDVIKLMPLNPQYRVYFADKSHVDISNDLNEIKKVFETLEKGSGKKLDDYLKDAKEKYNIAMNSFLYKNAYNVADLVTPELAVKAIKMGIFGNLHKHVEQYFKNNKIQNIIEFNCVFLGSAPEKMPSLFSLMTHVDMNLNVFYPIGGMYSIIKKFYELCKENGVKFHFNSAVDKMIVESRFIKQIKAKGKLYPTDIVVSNADYKHSEDLLSDQNMRVYDSLYWAKKIVTPSVFLIFLGVRGKVNNIIHHTLYFSDDWDGHFRDIFKDPKLPKEPSIYLNKVSDTDKTTAPKNHENIMVLVPIAPGLKISDSEKKSYSKYIIKYIEEKLDLNIERNIVYKKIFTVSDFEDKFNSFKGNAFGGLAHTLFQSSIWRTRNKSNKIDNLYFAGANTVPGIGLPPAIISAHLVRDLIIYDK